MKKLAIYFVAIAFTALAGCGMGTQQKAVEYNDKIVGQTDKLNEQYLEMSKKIEKQEFAKAEEIRKQVETDCKSALKVLEDIGDFKGNNAFQLASIKYVTKLKSMTENEMKELLEIVTEMNAIAADAEVAEYQKILELNEKLQTVSNKVIKEDEQASNAFGKAQKEFAAKYDIRLQANPMQNEIDKVNKSIEEIE